MNIDNIKTFIKDVNKKISKQNDIMRVDTIKNYILEIEYLISILPNDVIESYNIKKEIFSINNSGLNTIKEKLYYILNTLINTNHKSLGLFNSINKGILKLNKSNKKLYNNDFILKLLNNEFKHLRTLLNYKLDTNFLYLSIIDYDALKNLPHNLKEFKRKNSILRDILINYSDLSIYKNLIPSIDIENLSDDEILLKVYKSEEEINSNENKINIKENLDNLVNFSNDLLEYNRLFSKINNLQDLLYYIDNNYKFELDIVINPNLELSLDKLFKDNINKDHKDFSKLNKYFLYKTNILNKSQCLTNLYMYLLEKYPNESRINFIKISTFLMSIKLTIGYFKGLRVSKIDASKETFDKIFYIIIISLIDLMQNKKG